MNQRARPSRDLDAGNAPEIDRYRSIVFPNHVRDIRKQQGIATLLGLSAHLPDIPYVRLSKIERGEVVAKASELRRIATVLNVAPEELLLDMDAPGFDIAAWALHLNDWTPEDIEEDRFAVLLAAAIRARREADRSLSIAQIERRYGLAPVMLSRLENGFKPLARWNAQAVHAICQLLGVEDADALRVLVRRAAAQGALDHYIPSIADPALRAVKTRARIATLRDELAAAAQASSTETSPHVATETLETRGSAPAAATRQDADPAVLSAIHAADTAVVRLAPVFGAPLRDGLIDRVPVGRSVEVPRQGGLNAYGLRVCRATLGAALPAHAIAIVDPDRFPSSGGLAVVREAGGLRLVIVTFDRHGRMLGYSQHPEREILLDELAPDALGTVIGVAFD